MTTTAAMTWLLFNWLLSCAHQTLSGFTHKIPDFPGLRRKVFPDHFIGDNVLGKFKSAPPQLLSIGVLTTLASTICV